MTRPPLRRGRFRPRNRGQALVEFALVLPILVILLLSIIQFAFIFAAQTGVTNAVREAARLAAVNTPTVNAAQATTSADAIYAKLIGANGLMARNVFGFAAGNVVTPGTSVCYLSFPDGPGVTAIKVKVTGQYLHPIFIPLLDRILDGLDGTNDGGLRIGTAEEMTVENGVLTTTDISSVSPNCKS
jgi:Flp pilus assembly protein TadG